MGKDSKETESAYWRGWIQVSTTMTCRCAIVAEMVTHGTVSPESTTALMIVRDKMVPMLETVDTLTVTSHPTDAA
jgi:hypothetical protein